MWNLKYDPNKLIYETENRLVVAKRERGGVGVWGQQMQTIIHRMEKQQRPTVYNRECVQYPVINHSGKESEKEYK